MHTSLHTARVYCTLSDCERLNDWNSPSYLRDNSCGKGGPDKKERKSAFPFSYSRKLKCGSFIFLTLSGGVVYCEEGIMHQHLLA